VQTAKRGNGAGQRHKTLYERMEETQFLLPETAATTGWKPWNYKLKNSLGEVVFSALCDVLVALSGLGVSSH